MRTTYGIKHTSGRISNTTDHMKLIDINEVIGYEGELMEDEAELIEEVVSIIDRTTDRKNILLIE